MFVTTNFDITRNLRLLHAFPSPVSCYCKADSHLNAARTPWCLYQNLISSPSILVSVPRFTSSLTILAPSPSYINSPPSSDIAYKISPQQSINSANFATTKLLLYIYHQLGLLITKLLLYNYHQLGLLIMKLLLYIYH